MPTGRTEGRAARRRAARALMTAALAVAALGPATAPGVAAPAAPAGGTVPGLPEEGDTGPAEVPEIPDGELPGGEDVPEIPDADEDGPALDEDGPALDEEGPALGEDEPGFDEGEPAEPLEGEAGTHAAPGDHGSAPTAEVSPAAVRPGAHVTVSVTCPATGRPAPAALDANSPAFEKRTVALARVPGHRADPAYRGTARITPAGHTGEHTAPAGPGSARTVEGTCPAPHGGKGRPWKATFTVTAHDGAAPCREPVRPGEHCATAPPCPEPVRPGKPCASRPPCPEPVPEGGSCEDAPAPHGVRAGTGGAFTDSVPALVAGGVLVAGAFAAAAHRLRPRRRTRPGGG
ncbi:hypothetical protein [Streptomyces daghestanicus]|uniref:Secreted protein n=1 Tax=Streptomyces daghestanicus TaxID=66885 RepID=A0ABQ3Q6A5_9ACTN|nr:hypothetical protein [Streptomyces daghestanicus]GGU32199.1 hypothetical protein GCM10010259_23430 [Streptomyces daghestanicus]GHI32791.1 hypothetical protein Sdagh_45210 [Streptomyces daghestanicus]